MLKLYFDEKMKNKIFPTNHEKHEKLAAVLSW